MSTDASEDIDQDPAATSKSLIKSFDTVGLSEHLNKTPMHHQPRQQYNYGGQLLPI